MHTTYACSIDDLLKLTAEVKGSDLHLVVGDVPSIRINGDIIRQDKYPPISVTQMKELIYSMLSEEQIVELENELELDYSYSIPSCARYRANIIVQRNSLAAVFRVVLFDMPELNKLGLPKDVNRLCELPRGLVLVTGPTGSGKSTTLASMINHINTNYASNIVTVEDPIEFLHSHKKSIVRQREIGIDTHSFARALRQVLRHDPDVIMIGEMRDLESMKIAISAAETGHLVFSTLHTQTAPLTISRIVDSFPESEKDQIRQQLANTLKAVISQQLIPTADGKGRVAAIEYMVDTAAVRSMIREGKEHQLYSTIQTGHNAEMRTMDQALIALLKQGKISTDSVFEFCIDRTEVERLLSASMYR